MGKDSPTYLFFHLHIKWIESPLCIAIFELAVGVKFIPSIPKALRVYPYVHNICLHACRFIWCFQRITNLVVLCAIMYGANHVNDQIFIKFCIFQNTWPKFKCSRIQITQNGRSEQRLCFVVETIHLMIVRCVLQLSV